MRSKFLTGMCGLGLAFVLILGGCSDGSTEPPPDPISEFTPTPTDNFTAVTNIAEIASWTKPTEDMTLDSTVVPSDATNKTIVWSVKDAGGTGATLDGSTLKPTAEGTVTVTAIIANGKFDTEDYTKDFTVSTRLEEVEPGAKGTLVYGGLRLTVIDLSTLKTATLTLQNAVNNTVVTEPLIDLKEDAYTADSSITLDSGYYPDSMSGKQYRTYSKIRGSPHLQRQNYEDSGFYCFDL